MWLSDRKKSGSSPSSHVGEVTVGGKNTGLYTDGEMRNASFFSPGGYYWLPKPGQNMIVIKNADNEVCCMNREITELPVNMEVGEVYIMSAGGASLYLKNDGSIQIAGDLDITGRICVNGHEID